jgi:hypothetical protein
MRIQTSLCVLREASGKRSPAASFSRVAFSRGGFLQPVAFAEALARSSAISGQSTARACCPLMENKRVTIGKIEQLCGLQRRRRHSISIWEADGKHSRASRRCPRRMAERGFDKGDGTRLCQSRRLPSSPAPKNQGQGLAHSRKVRLRKSPRQLALDHRRARPETTARATS